jgi:hypothetical protein
MCRACLAIAGTLGVALHWTSEEYGLHLGVTADGQF